MKPATVNPANSEIQQILIQTMNGRMYDPVIGRVLSPDKFVQAAGYTQSYNRYSYCMNNPLRYTDPSGWTYLAYMESLYNWEGAGFYYRGSYMENTSNGWACHTQSLSGWTTGATPPHYDPAPGSEGYTFVGKDQNGEGTFIDNATGNNVDANTALRPEVTGYAEGIAAQEYVHGLIDDIEADNKAYSELAAQIAQDNYDKGLLAMLPPGGDDDKKQTVINGFGGLNSVLNFAAQGNIRWLTLTTNAVSPFFGLYTINYSLQAFNTTDKSYGDFGKLGVQITGAVLTTIPEPTCVGIGYTITILDMSGALKPFYNYLDDLGKYGGYVPIGNGLIYIPSQKK